MVVEKRKEFKEFEERSQELGGATRGALWEGPRQRAWIEEKSHAKPQRRKG
jgi:hypothetical protein